MSLEYRAMEDASEHYFTCPYCWEPVSMVLDLSVAGQTFVEDCEVCCHPIEITYQVEAGTLSAFSTVKAQ